MNIRQLNDADTMIRTFAARCDTALDSRKLCGRR